MTAHAIENIRNFSIIAHIDHGKSTLADRLIQQTGTMAEREMVEQVLDSMDIERERGITIKAQTVRLEYRAKDGKTYILNLMDTPGHVDFAYEVSRSLAACEGSLLVVDASQGVEAQTLANVYHALDAGHEIVPVLNKIDLPAAEPERIKEQIEDVIGLDASDAVPISAKTGLGVDLVLEAIVTRLPPPKGDETAPLKALLVDSWYDAYLGVVVLVRVMDGVLKKGMRIRMMRAGASYEIDRIGVFRPKMSEAGDLGPGEIGYITAQIKQVADTRIGDTITEDRRPTAEALPGFKPAQPVVFCGLFPVDAADFEDLRAAMGRLRLNDASFSYEMETSAALGFGFRCGFLGLLHLEIIQERLEREFDLDLIATAPSVIYRIKMSDKTEIELHNPADMPDPVKVAEIEEPWIKATILTPDDYLGAILKLCQDRRGNQLDLNYVGKRAMVVYELPLNEVVFDFYDRLKSISKGYASFDYALTGYRAGDLVKMSILVNGEPVDALSMLVHRDRAEFARPRYGREAQGPHPPAHVPDPGAGGARSENHRPRDDPGATQGRHSQVLRRRRDAKAQAARKAEGRQKTHAPVRQGRDSTGSFHRGAQDGQLRRPGRAMLIAIWRLVVLKISRGAADIASPGVAMWSLFALLLLLLPVPALAGVKETVAALAPSGVVLVEDAQGHALATQNADEPFVPASVTKIVTAWLALEVLGPDYRFKTRFYLDGNRVLYVRGGGDPFLVSEELAPLAAKLVAAIGKAPITGIVLDASYYPSNLRIPGIEDDDEAYNALNSALAVNFNTVFAVRDGNRVRSAEKQTPITPLAISQFRTRGPNGSGRISLSQDPAVSLQYAGELIAAFIERAGGSVKGNISTGTVPEGLKPVYVHAQSRTLSEILVALLRDSNNYIANQVFLEIGAHRLGGPVSLEKSLAVANQILAAHGLAGSIHLEEGSGISRDNRFTAQGLAQVLALFAPHADLLRGHDGGLNKTGTMEGIRTLAGYADTSSHGRVRFVFSLAGADGGLRFRLLRAIESEL